MDVWSRQGLSRCVHRKFLRFSLYAVLVCKARRPADFDDRPFVSQNSHMSATRVPESSSCCNRTSPCLMSLRSQNLCWFSHPLRFSQRWAMSTGNDACLPRDFTFLYCGVQVLSVPPPVWSRSTGFGNHQFPSLPGSHLALLIPFLVGIELFFSPGLRAFFCLPPKSHSSAK